MKAVTQNNYGGIEELTLTDIPKPMINNNEILIKTHAVNIASGDMRINTLSVPFYLKPIMRLVFGWKGPRRKVRGISASGVVAKIGSNISNYKIGDEVYFINSMKASCLADYVVLNEKSVMAKKPKNMSFVEAAPLAFGAMSAYHFINRKSIKKDDKVLIYGASGSVGSYALQLAKYYGAIVTAVSSEKNHPTLVTLGADHTIDYKQTDIASLTKKYDVIFDAVGKITKGKVKHILEKNGKYYTIKMPTKEQISRLIDLNEIIKANELQTLIDSEYSVEQFKEAHKKTYSGHKVGNVVINWNN
jgi:NADPH:quinone reductase-like Zn-dependent oxidoreductase